MATEGELEQILSKFEALPELFSHPRILSHEHADVTAKYLISALGLVPERREDLIQSFCKRFNSDEREMHFLLSSKDHSVDYLLYSAFNIHCQLQLGMDEESFLSQFVRQTFTDYQDGTIRGAQIIPLKSILRGMPKQFLNWSRVTEVEVETAFRTYKLEKGRVKATKKKIDFELNTREMSDFIMRRWTIPSCKQRVHRVLDSEPLEKILLQRDCDHTLYSFRTTFQELYGQKDLVVERLRSEADGEYSEYKIRPSAPYKSMLWKTASAVGVGLMHLSVVGEYVLRYLEKRENRRLREEVFSRDQILLAQSAELRSANAALFREYEKNIGLLQKVSELKQSGDRHTIRNALSRIATEERDLIIDGITKYLHLTYQIAKSVPANHQFLVESCSHFGLTDEMLASPRTIREQLRNVVVRERAELREEPDPDLEGINLGEDLLGLFSQDIYFDVAYAGFMDIKRKYQSSLDGTYLDSFDPFVLFGSLLNSERVIATINARLSSVGVSKFLDEVSFSSILEPAVRKAREDKGKKLDLISDIVYDPLLKTKREALEYMILDMCYNALDAGSTQIRVTSLAPVIGDTSKLPFIDQVLEKGAQQGTFPVSYICIEDNGRGILSDKAAQLNDYLEGVEMSEADLTTKIKDQGGLGTKRLRDFLGLHEGHCFYQRAREEGGTIIHLYLNKLNV